MIFRNKKTKHKKQKQTNKTQKIQKTQQQQKTPKLKPNYCYGMEKLKYFVVPFFFVFPSELQLFQKARAPQETSTRHILDAVVANDCMLCKSLHQMKWQYLKRKKHIQDITFQLSTILY